MFVQVRLYSTFWEIELKFAKVVSILRPRQFLLLQSWTIQFAAWRRKLIFSCNGSGRGMSHEVESGISFPASNFTICDADCVARRTKKSAKASRNWINIDRRSDVKIEWRLDLGLYSQATNHLPRLWMFFVTTVITTRFWHTFSNSYYTIFWWQYSHSQGTQTHVHCVMCVQSLFNSSEGWSTSFQLIDR